MLISRVAYRFARAIIQLAIEKNELEKVFEDMLLIEKTCKENRDLTVMLGSPVVKVDKKEKVFTQIFGKHISKMTSTFFGIVFRRNREELITEISESFVKQYKEFKKIHTVTIESAHPLNDQSRKEVLAFLKTRTNDEIELVEKVNEELIGGLILRMNDLQIDASVKNNLKKLEKEFSKDLYSVKY